MVLIRFGENEENFFILHNHSFGVCTFLHKFDLVEYKNGKHHFLPLCSVMENYWTKFIEALKEGIILREVMK